MTLANILVLTYGQYALVRRTDIFFMLQVGPIRMCRSLNLKKTLELKMFSQTYTARKAPEDRSQKMPHFFISCPW